MIKSLGVVCCGVQFLMWARALGIDVVQPEPVMNKSMMGSSDEASKEVEQGLEMANSTKIIT